MAGCYHDTQDFKSKLNIEVAREGDILEASQDLNEIKCDKNPGHEDFIPFKYLDLYNLPNEHKNKETLDNIKRIGSVVVKLLVKKKRKRKRETGSGFVIKIDNEYYIQTNNHVVKTEDEVNNCIVEFHYDDKDRKSVETSRGVKLKDTDPYRDITIFTFEPVPEFLHQLDWGDLPSIVILYENNRSQTELVIPHISSEFTFVSSENLNNPLIMLMFISLNFYSISYLKSSYFKFQPIPFNIQEVTSIDIHIDEGCGKSRVIPGDVVKLDDDFVVEISESIFQNVVKKCRLVWNGEVIGRGTRLYFQKVKTSDIRSWIDLEKYQKFLNSDYIWRFDCHPKRGVLLSRVSKDLSYWCCIGHPHSGIKMVTFGRCFGTTTLRIDSQGRDISEPGPDCRCKEVQCAEYSCKTCPGSSGFPAIPLHEGMELKRFFTHFMGHNVIMGLKNGELIQNKNMASC